LTVYIFKHLFRKNMSKFTVNKQSAFMTGIPAGAAIIGSGLYTKGFILQVREEHPPGAATLTGHYKLIHGATDELVVQHMPVSSQVAKNMSAALCKNSQNKFASVRTAILDTIGVEHNAEQLNEHMFHPKQWSVFQVAEPIKRKTDAQKAVDNQVLQAEIDSIAAISCVPSEGTRKAIYATATAAKTNPALCSKLKPPASEDGRVDPSKSVLVKIATGQPLPWARDGMPKPEIHNNTFAILKDAFPPLLPSVHRTGALKGSNGPNGVLTKFGDDQRINLFDTDDAKTKDLLDAYLSFRDAHKEAIFNLTLAQMVAAKDAPAKYQKTVQILKRIQALSAEEFDATIGVVSFCQTWATSEGVSGPQFSVESPHFQTRFFIKSLDYITLSESDAEAYVETVKAHDARMAELDYTGKFVHLDGLQQELTNVIWILGASTSETFKKIEQNVTHNTKIVICASLETYQTAMKSKQVYKLPTNLRTHHGPVPQTMGSIVVRDTESFKAAQKDASAALANTLNLASARGIPVYFAIVERKNRPTYLVQDDDGTIRATDIDSKDHAIPNADVELSNNILQQLLLPSYEDAGIDAREAMRNACAHHATYLADVLTVGCALVGEDAWTPYQMTAPAGVLSDGSFPEKGFVDKTDGEVSYLSARFEQSGDGLFKSFKQDAVPQMTQALRDIMRERRKCFGKSLVIHDALLNDVDDFPAIRLIQQISGKTELFQNYSD
jgi:hypothetical protein